MTDALNVIGSVLLVLGGLIFVGAAIGLFRLPDLYTRISAVTTAAGLGIVFVMVGALLLQPGISNTVKVVITVPLQLATSAVGSMAIARSAYLTGSKLTESTRYNDLDQHP